MGSHMRARPCALATCLAVLVATSFLNFAHGQTAASAASSAAVPSAAPFQSLIDPALFTGAFAALVEPLLNHLRGPHCLQAGLPAAGFAQTLQGQFTSLKEQFSSEIGSQLTGLSSAVSNLNFGVLLVAVTCCQTCYVIGMRMDGAAIARTRVRRGFLAMKPARQTAESIVRMHHNMPQQALFLDGWNTETALFLHITGQAFLDTGAASTPAAALQAQLQTSLCVAPTYVAPVDVPAQCSVRAVTSGMTDCITAKRRSTLLASLPLPD